ncbi:MFS transporter [Pseudolysinimonas sp.]|uniref:MFS transporter n=1 Tax=Pseudolysinimonas sp. TaxID=2680009 RepID=UPI0032634679
MSNGVGLRSERGPVLLAVMVVTGLVAIDATILATAVPSIVGDLGGFASFPWLFSSYLLASAVTVPVYSKLADTIGRKPVILFGVAAFLLGSVLCGLAWNMESLIAFRVVQGIGAGAILPISITIIGDIYSLQERARVQGYVASVWGVASVLGPTLGGLFAQFNIWRAIFFINIPLALVSGFLLIRAYREKVERRKRSLDIPGAVLLTSASSLILLGVLEGGRGWEWGSPLGVGIFVVGAALLMGFVAVELRASDPIIALGLFRRRIVSTSVILGVTIGAALVGLTAYVPTYLEGTVPTSPVIAGLSLATLTIGWPLAAAISGWFYLRFGFRPVVLVGAALVLVGTAFLAATAATPSIAFVAISCFVIGFGFGLSAVPSLVAAQSSVEWQERGVVTGLNMFGRSIGQAFGVAILGAIANAVIAGHGGDQTDRATLIAASSAVFIGAAVVAVLLLAAAIALPGRTQPVEAPASS